MQSMERSTRSSRRDANSASAQHAGSQHDSGQFLCIDCNKTFASKLQLNSHRQSHTAKKPYVCTHCGRGFHHQVFLQMHERSHEDGSPCSQTSAAKPSPSRVISTRSCKVVAPVEEDKVHVTDPPSKHDPSGNTMVEFRKEKPTHRIITPIECVTRLTRGKAPALYQQSDDPEKSPFGFHISKYSDTTVRLMDAFGNSIELLTEVFNTYASTEPAEIAVLSGQTQTSPHHPGQSNSASPVHEGSCRNGLRDSAASPVANGISHDSVADVTPALPENGQNDDSGPSAAVTLVDSSQENCEATTGHQEGLSDLLEERTSPPMSEPDRDDGALDEQMETDDGISGNFATDTSALAHPAAVSSAPDPASSLHEDATENPSECDGNADILLSDHLPDAAVEQVGQSVETQNMSPGDGEMASSEAVSVSREEDVHKDNGFLEKDAQLPSDTETQLVSPTGEQDNPEVHSEAVKGIDDQCEPITFNEGQQKIPSETTAEPSEQSECIDIARSESNTVTTEHTATSRASDDEETARPDDCKAGHSPARDITKEINVLESESSNVSLPQNESELNQLVSDSNEPDPDLQQPALCERDRVAGEPGGSAGDEAELPDKPESLQQASNGFPNQSIAPSEPPAEAEHGHETSPQTLSEGGAGADPQEPEGANTDHISPSAESKPKSQSVPDFNLSHPILTDTAVSQGGELPDQTGNPHLLIGRTEGVHAQPPEQLNVQGLEAERDKEEHSENPDQMTVRGCRPAETVPESEASIRDIVRQGSDEEESEILSNEDHMGSHEENLKPVLVTEQEITNEVATTMTECIDKPSAKPSPAVLSPEEDGPMDAVTPPAQVVYPEESPDRNPVTPHVESKDSNLSPDMSDPESNQDHPTIEEPKHLVPDDTTDQAPLDVHTTEDESNDQSTTDSESKGLLSSAEPFDESQKDLMEGEPGGVSPQTQTTHATESSAASSLSKDQGKDVLDNATTPRDPDPSAEPSTEGSPCEELLSNPQAIAVAGPASSAKEDVSANSPCQPPADQTSAEEKKLDMSPKRLQSPKSKFQQAISEMSVYCMSGKLLTVGAKCLLCDQKLRTYRGEISSPICRKCRLSRKKGDPCFGTDLSPHSLSSLERNLLTKASPCNIKKEVPELEESVKPLDSGEAEAETAAKKMYKCHKCDKSFSLPALLAGHVKFHSLPKCLTCGRPMRLRYRVRRIPRNCRMCTKKLKNRKKEEGTFLLNESSDEGKSDGEWPSVSQASLRDDKDDPEQLPRGVKKYKPRTHKVAKAKLSARKFHHTRRGGKKAAVSVGASKRRARAPLKNTGDGCKNTSVKPYKCTKCPVAFKRPIYLVKHMRKHLPSAPHTPFTVLKGSPHHSDCDVEKKSLVSRDLLGRRPGEKPVLRQKRQKQGLDESAKQRGRRPAKKPRMSKANLSPENSEEISSDGYSVGNPCQVLNQGEGSRMMTPFGGLSAKEELDETPISQQNECNEEGALSDSSINSPDASTSGDKPHVCQHCGKCFQYYRSLHLHVLVHTAVQCESCGCRLRFKKRAGRRSKKCRLCRLQEKEQAFELQLAAATKKPLSLGKARASALLPPNKKPRSLKSLKGQSLSELKQMSKGMKQLLVKGLARKPRKQKSNLVPLPVVGRKKKVRDLLESNQLDPLGGDHQGSGLATSAIKLEDGTFADSAGKVKFVSTMKMKRAKGLVTESQAAGEETQEPPSDQTSALPLASDKPSLCSVCDQDFENQELLFAHMESHAEVLLFSCPQCPHRFHKKQLLKIHLLTHIKDRPHRCPDCNKTFTRINHLNMHRRVHMGIRPYSCPDCPSSFRHKVSLLVHRYSHAKVLPIDLKPYQCAYCAKRFLRSDHLEVHQRFHTGECPFQCPDCDKTFPSKARLSIHSRVHSGVRPHVCPTCQRSFIHKANLERHLQKHTGEMAFSCGKCAVRFPSLMMLAQHKHTHRREEVFSCVHCAKRFLYKKSLLKHQDVCQGNKKGKLADGQARGIKRKRKTKEQQDSAEPEVKKRRPRLKKNVTSTKLERGGKPLKMRKIKKETLIEEEKDQGTPNENLDMEQNETEKGKKKPMEGKPVKVKKIKKEKAVAEEEQEQDTSKESVKPEENGTEKGKKRPLEEKTLKVKKIRKKARPEERQEDPSNESGTNKVRKKQTEGTRPKTDGKQEKMTAIVRAKKEKAQKEGVKLKTQKEESVKSKKSSEGPKQGEDKPKNSRLGVKRGPYKKRVKLGAPGEKKKIVRVKVKSVQVKLKPGPKKKQGMKEKKEKV